MSTSLPCREFTQKRALHKTTFSFGDEELTYTYDNSRTKLGSHVQYRKIPGRMNYREIGLWWLRYVFVFYVSFCLITCYYFNSINDYGWMLGTFYAATLLFGVMTLLALLFRQQGLFSFPLHPPLIVLRDGQQDAIIGEIKRRRHEMMREKLMPLDTHRPYYEEAGKFSWLHEEGIITEQEYMQIRTRLAVQRDKTLGVPGPPEPTP